MLSINSLPEARSGSDEAKNLYHWVQWIVMCDLPPSIVENECYRLNTEKIRMKVCIKTIEQAIQLIYNEIVKKIK